LNKKAVAFIAFVVFMALLFLISLFFVILSTVPSPLDKSIVKEFVYDIDPTYPPVVGLEVDLYNSIGLVDTEVTDLTGHVTFTGLKDETYTMKWMWGGVEKSESKMIDCTKIVWDWGTNKLESKSGGGLRLAEAREQSLSRQPSSDSQNG